MDYTRRAVLKSLSTATLVGITAPTVLAKSLGPQIPTPGPATLLGVWPSLDDPFIDGNNILNPGNTHCFAYTQQKLGLGWWIEARLNSILIDGTTFGVCPPSGAQFLRQRGVDWPMGMFYSHVVFEDSNAEGTNQFQVFHGAGGPGLPPIVYESGSLGEVTSVRIRIHIGSKLRYFLNYAGPSSVPFWESGTQPPTPLVAHVAALNISGDGSWIEDVYIGH